MKKNKKFSVKKIIKENKKGSIAVYVILRFLVLCCLVNEIINRNLENVFLCLFSLVLLIVPLFIEEKLKIYLHSLLESMIFIFIFSSEILGEINNFYLHFKNWDTILHTINGFLCASIGFSLIYLLNENSEKINLSPIFVSLVAFCFSMTIGVLWEFYEYGNDILLKGDMQKDEFVSNIYTTKFNFNGNGKVESFPVDHTIIYDADNNEVLSFDGYLDIGIKDTMADLGVNFIGATVYSFFGYLYIINKDKYKFAGKFLVTKKVGS